VSIPLVINGGAIADVNAAGAERARNLHRHVVRGDRRKRHPQAGDQGGGGATFDKPVDNIGNKTLDPGYAAYAAKHMYT
jgi:hypothetical protein